MAKKTAVDTEQQIAFKRALQRTWETIGSDVEQAADEAGESLDLRGVAECVLDYVYMYGMLKGDDKIAWEGLSFDKKMKHSLAAFRGRV